MDDGALWAKLILIAILTGINAFFASAEMAMVSVNNNKIKEMAEEGDKRAKTLLSISSDQTRFLSTIQVAITLAGFFSSGSAATSISQVFGRFLSTYGIPYGGTVSFILVTFLLSYITLVFGELVPKRIALQNSEKVALKSSNVIAFASKIFYPFVKLLSFSTALVLKMMGKYSEDVEEKISEEELKSYIKVSTQQGVINSAGEEMIVNIMDFDDKLAYEIMTPRTSIYMVDYDEFTTDTVTEILKMGYSRMPVFRENTDNILGTVYIKDLFVEYAKNDYEFINLDKCIKSPYFVPETKKIDMLLKELQASKNYVAILIDEYGGFSGMVTVEDIVEEIVGEIEDEYDKENHSLEKISDNEYIVDGSMDIEDINDELGTSLYSENHETISGLIIEKLGFIPEENEKKKLSVKTSGCILTELAVADKRIVKASVKVIPEEQEEAKREYKEFNS
ncbi:hemolysin family protein [Peptoniphilus senegalensis]|uniref:hemolysin family protein n=1 Tax=Peptoniphilus senegalensis TaxID=1465757 RepID=UPI0002F4AA18|nr:hemolysin family protein [Peptoniphilus senegalensis]